CQRGITQLDFVTFLESAVDFHRREPAGAAKEIVCLAARFEQWSLFLDSQHLCAGQPLHRGKSRGVIAMRMRDQQDPDIREAESELLDPRANLRDGKFKTCVDQDATLSRHD